MRVLIFVAAILSVMGLAFWAYRENYRTQAVVDLMQRDRSEIATLRDELAVLHAEWAFLNRPERLAELVDLNFDKLKLLPIRPDQMVPQTAIAYPTPVPTPEPTPETTPEPTPETAP